MAGKTWQVLGSLRAAAGEFWVLKKRFCDTFDALDAYLKQRLDRIRRIRRIQ